ncbi:MAG TPA: hypothetical protein ENK01_00095, partial [Hellea balneolensis]|nr:hypothetical protein [Hellea balneolensis]
AMLVIDRRCLHKPLMEALTSNLKILSDLGLTPVLLLGALQDEKISVRAQSQRLCRALEAAKIRYGLMNCATYRLIPEIQKIMRAGRMVVLEDTGMPGSQSIDSLCERLRPKKVLFLQPSGCLRNGAKRISVLNIDRTDIWPRGETLSAGQKRSLRIATSLLEETDHDLNCVIVSPLNLLAELFTIEGAGTLLRKGAEVICQADFTSVDQERLRHSIEAAFERTLVDDFLLRRIAGLCLEVDYRGGAIVTELAGLPYLSKFWVSRAAQGEGIGRDIWQVLIRKYPTLFWRSRNDNPFNTWYMKMCDGMQTSGEWRVFWIGLEAPEIPGAVIAAANAPHDFET